jgi:hypothetical protein
MISRPTYDDANLILRLYETRRDDRMREARQWYAAKFKPKKWEDLATLVPPGSADQASFRMVVSYWDMVASFIVTGVLNKELFFQSGRELLVVFERLRPVLPGIRDDYKDPLYLGNLERVGLDYAAYWQSLNPEAYEAFAKRVG